MPSPEILELHFDGTCTDRKVFLAYIIEQVFAFTQHNDLCIFLHEIAKNIFDHAKGKGSLKIERTDHSYIFIVQDEGSDSFDFNFCTVFPNPRLIGNGINCGFGLQMILDMSKSLGIHLNIDTSRGFCYSGTYIFAQKAPLS